MATILVNDDMAIVRDPIAASFELAGYRAVTASGGMQALAVRAAEYPDLVRLDVAMPELTAGRSSNRCARTRPRPTCPSSCSQRRPTGTSSCRPRDSA